MQRHIDTHGLINFRDLGHYPALDHSGSARQVKPGLLFRSGHFHEAGEEARQVLLERGIRRAIDFRSEKERQKKPGRVVDELGIHVLALDLDPGSGASFQAGLQRDGRGQGVYTDAAMAQVMCEINRSLVRDHQDKYRAFFRCLLDQPAQPLVFHCASGKDRTGLAAALLLSALGVDEQTIIEDYLLTNACIDVEHQVARALDDFDERYSAQLDATALKAMYEVRPEYLAAALDEIAAYGGMARYLREQLLLDEMDLQCLQRRYLGD